MELSDCRSLPTEVEEVLWRLAQEALSNIARHSQASRVKVSLICEPGKVTLSIWDNGKGFEEAALNHSGVGLHSMRERVEGLGGKLTLQSKVGEGTMVLAECSY